MERVNDQDIDMMAKTAGNLPEFEQTVLYKSDQEKPKPVIVNTTAFNFDNKKVPIMAKKSKLPVEKLGASKPVPVKIIQDTPSAFKQ
jgi:hypothetical protein